MDRLAISIGSNLQEAWNVINFGKKRWILWDHARWENNDTLQLSTTRDWVNNDLHITGTE